LENLPQRKYGYEFDYPPDWILEEDGDAINVGPPYDPSVGIYVDAGSYDSERHKDLVNYCKPIKFSGAAAYYCDHVSRELGGSIAIDAYSIRDKNVLVEIRYAELDSVTYEVLSTFRLF
jgi:hypothetical protein